MKAYIDADKLVQGITELDAITNYDSWTAKGKHKAYADIIAAIKRMPTENVEPANGWINANIETPKPGERVLACWEMYDKFTDVISSYIDILQFEETLGWFCTKGAPNGKVVAWMPLPKAPRIAAERRRQ